jgi:hypothetical protein
MEDAKTPMTKSQTQGIVLEELQGKEQRPSDLLESLTSQGYPSLEIKRVLTRLLDEQLIELTSQRMLRMR